MNHTTNYQLSQWAKSDQVKMEDFNADNAKIDAALKAVADSKAAIAALNALAARVTALENKSRFTKLWELTLTAEASSITIPLTGVNWSQWDKVHLEILATNGSQMEMYFNEYVWGTTVFYVTNSRPNFTPRYTFYPGFRADRQIEASFVDKRFYKKEPISSLKRLVIRGSDAMPVGGKFILWGEV